MTITIRLKTDNAAFDDDCAGEVGAIIQDAIRRVANGSRVLTLKDSNGNTVGTVTVTGK
jgi:hypothetical protein